MAGIEEFLKAKGDRIDELHRCVPGRTALLVVDMQRGFLDPGAALELPDARATIPHIKRLIDTCRAKQVPVVFTEYVYATNVPCLRGDPFGPEHLPAAEGDATGFGMPSNNCLIPPRDGFGPDSAETIPELAPLPGELVVAAHTYDKFYGTPLDLALRSQDIRYLIITGIVAEICVTNTLCSAANRDYFCTAVTDGIAAVTPELMKACCEIWDRKYARLRTTSQIVDEIGGF